MTGHLFRDLLQLLHSLAEVSDPLDDCETRRDSVAPPAPWDDAWGHTEQGTERRKKMTVRQRQKKIGGIRDYMNGFDRMKISAYPLQGR